MNGDAMKNTTHRDERNKTRSFRAAFAARDRAEATPGFAIQILRDTDLGIATLIVEDEEGHYEPVNYAAHWPRFRDGQRGPSQSPEEPAVDKDPGLCPQEYKVWARGLDGKMVIAATEHKQPVEPSRRLLPQPIQRDFLEGPVFFVQSLLPAPLL